MTNTKKIITVALAAVAITTASLASTGSAYAGGRHGHFFHDHHRGVFFAAPVYASCWKWVFFKGFYKKIYVCGY